MGSLHNGHLSLVEKAVKENSNVIVSIFVNPTQFDNKSDLENYPQNLKNDLKQLQKFNNCLLYTSPSPRDGLLSRMPSSA